MYTLFKIAGTALVTLALAATPVLAENVEIKMLNKGQDGIMVFEPAHVNIAPGDTVTFMPTDKGHNAETIKGLIPEGAEPFKGKFNEELAVTFDVPGVYAVKCMPHYAMGMVALITVGDEPTNMAAIRDAKFPPKAQERVDIAIELAGL